MASLFTNGKFQATNASGAVPGAKLYTYAAGTTTPLATYTLQDGVSSNANPVICNAAGQASVWLGNSPYRMILKDASDVTIWDVDNVSVGAAGVAYDQSVDYAAGTVGAALQREIWADLLGSNSGAVNAAAVLSAAVLCQAQGGGKVRLPAGNFPVSTIAWDPALYPDVGIQGSGKTATTLTKSDATTTPVLDITGTTLINWQQELSDLSIVGLAYGSPGLRTTLLGLFTIRNVAISACSEGWDNVGSLIGSVYDLDLQGNENGYVQNRHTASSVYPNLITFYGGQVISNTVYGFDIVHGHGITWDHVDLEMNGVLASNTTTGGINIRSTTNLESPYASFALRNCWFEQNYGIPLTVEGGALLSVTLDDCKFIRNSVASTSLVARFGAIESVTLNSVVAVSVLTGMCEMTIAASRTSISNSIISTITDTSTSYVYKEVGTFSLYIPFRVGNASGNSDINPTSATIGGNVEAGDVTYGKRYTLADSGTVDLDVPVGSDCYGAMVFVRGRYLGTGISYTRQYNIAIKTGGGAGSDVVAVLVESSGDATPSFTFSNASGFLRATAVSSGGQVSAIW
jgi:hypothetical protein